MSKQQKDELAIIALRKFITRLSDYDADDLDEDFDVFRAAEEAAERIEQQQERINELEDRIERLEATSSGPELKKREKHEAVINAAENKQRAGPGGTKLTKDEVMAATGVTRRHSYTLMSQMGELYDWAKYDRTTEPYRLIVEVGNREWGDLVGSVYEEVGDDVE